MLGNISNESESIHNNVRLINNITETISPSNTSPTIDHTAHKDSSAIGSDRSSCSTPSSTNNITSTQYTNTNTTIPALTNTAYPPTTSNLSLIDDIIAKHTVNIDDLTAKHIPLSKSYLIIENAIPKCTSG